ncbi:MAG: response regulator [Oscillibacter sp.]|nr:response regulator [Oscillibacter sp.]
MKRILIVDDDSSMGTMLKFVIAREQLGEVVGAVSDESQAVEEILFYQPDIVLIDLLFPHTDGIQIMTHAMARGAVSHFIMISQAQDKNMEEMAYKEGIDFFIHKPINVLEIRKVLQNVIQITEMEQMLSAVRQAVLPSSVAVPAETSNWKQKLQEILADIGIWGITGSREIAVAVFYLKERHLLDPHQEYQLADVYQRVGQELYGSETSAARQKGIEQKIRRAIQKAQTHLATRGNEDFYDDIFTEYASRLFDFGQVQQEMRFLQGKTDQPGKINTKKFFEGLLLKLD